MTPPPNENWDRVQELFLPAVELPPSERSQFLHGNCTQYRRSLRLGYEHFAALNGNPTVANLGRPEVAREYYEKARPMEEEAVADPHSSKFDYANFLMRSAMIEPPRDRLAASLEPDRQLESLFHNRARRHHLWSIAIFPLRISAVLCALCVFRGPRPKSIPHSDLAEPQRSRPPNRDPFCFFPHSR